MAADQSVEGPQGPWRILLTEDDAPVRARLAALLAEWEGADLVGVCATLAESLKAIEAEPLDLLITDLKLPDGNGIDAIRALRRTRPDAEAMVISVLADEAVVLQAIEAGASGYLLKDAEALDLTAEGSGGHANGHLTRDVVPRAREKWMLGNPNGQNEASIFPVGYQAMPAPWN